MTTIIWLAINMGYGINSFGISNSPGIQGLRWVLLIGIVFVVLAMLVAQVRI